ncbi:hypothetical protein GCM10022419_075940 [Nonomuraea rosea]|uniref:Beta-lactamase-related domain-containing protein n=1 Tax=Nonomuraea rosea TaxID=638574 RepID=A0ABP6YG10_9ACTN
MPYRLLGRMAVRAYLPELAAEPGAAFSYHNTNYQIAARLVEVVSGRPFAAYLDANVFAPLGMRRSRTIDTDRDLPGSARGHLYVLGRAIALPEPAGFGNGSGGVLSSAGDMARWLIAQDTGVLSPRSVKGAAHAVQAEPRVRPRLVDRHDRARPLALCAAIAPIFRVLARGGDIMWIQVVYLYPTFMIWLVSAATAGTAVAAARLYHAVRPARSAGGGQVA